MATKPLIILARHKYLLLVPFLVILPASLLLSIVMKSTTYTSRSIIFAQDLRFLPQAQSQGSQYLTPAQNQVNVLNELLATDTFATKVASTISKDGPSISPASVRMGTTVYDNGYSSMVVSHASGNAAEAQRIVKGVVDEYKDESIAMTQAQIQQASELISSELRLQEQALTDARDKLASYIQDHPSVLTSQSGGSDPSYLALQSTVQRATDAYNSTYSNQQFLNLSGLSTVTGIQNLIDVRDPANTPSSPDHVSLRKQMLFPIAGLLLAVSLAAAAYAFLLRTDNSIRVAEDLQALPGLALLGTVPDVSPVKKRGWPKHFYRLAVTALGVSAQR